jgi:NDP-sugar pyrophosphorylase family protein
MQAGRRAGSPAAGGVRAVILAGGKGTRLRPYTTILPKPLLPFGDRPVLEMIIRQLARHGYRHIDLCVGHLGSLIRSYFAEVPMPDGVELHYHWESQPLGTAGALRGIDDLDEPALVMNGDVVTTLDFGHLMRAHTDSGAAVTIAAHEKAVPIDLGVIEETDFAVTGYIEKPTMRFRVSMGVYVFDPRAVEHIPEGYFDFPDVVRALIAAQESVRIYPFTGKWFDIGTPAEYERAAAEYGDEPGAFLDV